MFCGESGDTGYREGNGFRDSGDDTGGMYQPGKGNGETADNLDYTVKQREERIAQAA